MGDKVRTLRISEEASSLLDANNKRHGDISYHTSNAIIAYFNQAPATVAKNATVKVSSKEVKPKTNNNEVKRLFDYWILTIGKDPKKTKLTAKRSKVIEARLKEGYTPEDIAKAIEGCASSEYHMGNNDQGAIYNDIELICRSGEKVENFAQYLNKPVFDNRANGGTNGRKKSLAERTIEGADKLQSLIEAVEDNERGMGENDSIVSQQVVIERGSDNGYQEREGGVEPEFNLMVQQDGGFNS